MRGRPGNLAEWEALAQKRLPRMIFDFVAGGAEDELTLRRNREAFEELLLVPQLLRSSSSVNTTTTVFGREIDLPVILSPAGGARMVHRSGEIGAARGASIAGTLSVLSGFASISPDVVARSVAEPQWLQIYLHRDRDVNRAVVERAARLGFSALVVTADTPVTGNRERDRRNGMTVPVKVRGSAVVEALRHPGWLANYLLGGSIEPDRESQPGSEADPRPRDLRDLAQYVTGMLNPDQSWEEIRWLREVWDGPLLVKGVLRTADALIALNVGCDGVVVSNHGGRQLDGVPAGLEVLPEIVKTVGGSCEVILDGGVRRGTDILKALALGARACMIGRPWLFSLAVQGELGVAAMLAQLRGELVRALQLVGAQTIEELSPEFVRSSSTQALM